MNAQTNFFISDQYESWPHGRTVGTKRRSKAKLLTLSKEWLLAGRTEDSLKNLEYVYNANGLDENCIQNYVNDCLNADVQYVGSKYVECEQANSIEIGKSFGVNYWEECKHLIKDIYIKGERPTVPPEAPVMHIRDMSEILIAMAPRRLSHYDKEMVKGIVADLLSQGIIRQSSSEYAVPIVLIKKKSGRSSFMLRLLLN